MKYKKEKDSKKFYFGKQKDYSKYRPDYPKELFEYLEKEYKLEDKKVVELGAGTGKFSKILSSYCKKIYYVEPNIDMLNEGKNYCKICKNIEYINAAAEETTINEKDIDIIFAVQCFHWFDKNKLKKEVQRILKKDGLFIIVWNDLEDENNEFSKEYFNYISNWKIKLTGVEYQHKNNKEREDFYNNKEYKTHTFIHTKKYTEEMLIGLSKSLSYAPQENEIYYEEFITGIIAIFNKYQKDNQVKFDMHTNMYIGRV